MAKKSKKTRGKRRATRDGPAAQPVSDEIIIGQGQAAKWLGVTARTIRRYVKEGMPRTQDGHYLRTLLKFYKASRGEEDIEHRAKGRLLDINLKELKVREKEHELGEAERRWRAEQEKKTVRQIRVIVDAHRRMVNKLPPLLARANKESQVKAILQAECRDICDGFAKGMKARSKIFD